jgi:cytochrome c5
MPARGGNPSLTDLEVKRGVAHLLEQVGVKVDVPAPAPPAAAAPAPAPAASPASAAAPSPTPPSAPASASGSEAGAAANLERGETIYKQACAACHAMGVVGAPKTGDRAAWAARIQQGAATLNQHALQGIRGMPPKGGRVDLPDEVVIDAVAFMVKESS